MLCLQLVALHPVRMRERRMKAASLGHADAWLPERINMTSDWGAPGGNCGCPRVLPQAEGGEGPTTL